MLIRARVHPFPSRTRKLSSLLPTILDWRRSGKIGNANIEVVWSLRPDHFRFSSIAQSVEHAAVNRGVVGSSPTGGAMRPLSLRAAASLFQQQLGPLAQLVRAAGS